LKGEGEYGERGGPPGDLFVVIHVEPHDIFQRDGDDIFVQVPISFATAALGGEIEVPTLNGSKTIRISKGTQPGQIFKLKGEGIPHLNGRGRGSEIVQVTVHVPEKLTKEQEVILRQFDELEVQQAEDKEPWWKFTRK